MGLSRTQGRPNSSRTARLAALADDVGPERKPWWVDRPRGQTPAQGWYWVPPGAESPSFLGHNAIRAELAIERYIEALG